MVSQFDPPESLIQAALGQSSKNYGVVAENFFRRFQKYGGIQPSHRILDVGCGCGRMAVPLTRFLTTGSYEGFDVSREAVTWCQENITPHFPAFRFQWVDVQNNFYNKAAKLKVKDFQFPYPDDFFDFTFLASVFTHMLKDDVEHYTREICRTLRPGGTALITFFIINPESKSLMRSPGSRVKFAHDYGEQGIKVDSLRNPEAVVGYPEEMARQMMIDNGLHLKQPLFLGSWCGRQGAESFQDFMILEKTPVFSPDTNPFRTIQDSLQ